MADRIQLRRDVSSSWTAVNPVLADGEIGLEKDTQQFKIGDGITDWENLPYGGLTGGGLNIVGSLDDESNLPESGGTGGYLIDGDLYIWTGTSWENAGPLQGPAGSEGPRGALLGVTTIDGTTHTLSEDDNGFVLYCTSSGNVAISTATGIGVTFSCMIVQGGTGQITITQGAGTTVASYGGFVKSAGQYATVTVFVPVQDLFVVAGQTA